MSSLCPFFRPLLPHWRHKSVRFLVIKISFKPCVFSSSFNDDSTSLPKQSQVLSLFCFYFSAHLPLLFGGVFFFFLMLFASVVTVGLWSFRGAIWTLSWSKTKVLALLLSCFLCIYSVSLNNTCELFWCFEKLDFVCFQLLFYMHILLSSSENVQCFFLTIADRTVPLPHIRNCWVHIVPSI